MNEKLVSARIKPLDGLRALAVMQVLLLHSFSSIYPGGTIGVDLFFVISGYVITAHLLRDRPSFKTFYLNRVERLLPPALLVIIITWLIAQTGTIEASNKAALAATFSVMNWFKAMPELTEEAGRLTHYWSLSVEEQFYFIWPILLAAILHRKIDPRKAIGVLIIVAMVWRVIGYQIGFSPERIYTGLDTRADALLMGCLLATLRPRDLHWMPPAAIAALLLLGCLSFPYGSWAEQARYPVVVLLSAVAVAGAAWSTSMWTAPLNLGLTQWVGARSYAIYLWHYPLIGVATTFGREWGVRGAVYIAAAWGVTFIASELTYRLIERPLRARRHRKHALTVPLAV